MVFRALPDAGDSDHQFPASRPTLNSQPLELVRERAEGLGRSVIETVFCWGPLLALLANGLAEHPVEQRVVDRMVERTEIDKVPPEDDQS